MKRANIPFRRKDPLLLIPNNLQKYGGRSSKVDNSRALLRGIRQTDIGTHL